MRTLYQACDPECPFSNTAQILVVCFVYYAQPAESRNRQIAQIINEILYILPIVFLGDFWYTYNCQEVVS